MKKRKERMAQSGDDADVTYINEKNKQFNQKLSRFFTTKYHEKFEQLRTQARGFDGIGIWYIGTMFGYRMRSQPRWYCTV